MKRIEIGKPVVCIADQWYQVGNANVKYEGPKYGEIDVVIDIKELEGSFYYEDGKQAIVIKLENWINWYNIRDFRPLDEIDEMQKLIIRMLKVTELEKVQ